MLTIQDATYYFLVSALYQSEKLNDCGNACTVTVPLQRWNGETYDYGVIHAYPDEVEAELQRRRDRDLAKSRREIKTAHTRELLQWLLYCRKFRGWYSPCDSKSEYGYYEEAIRAELATREHIPNKQEARANRREAAMMHRKSKLR